MRVIAGSARRTQLRTIESMDTRPTTDRIKETLFNMIQQDMPDCHFLDLFAGSGAIGIEALSRGASNVVFVENNRAAGDCIRDNLIKTHFENRGRLLLCDASDAIKRLEQEHITFDYIFMDPPYRCEHEKHILAQLSSSHLIHMNTVIIVEASLETQLDYLDDMGFMLIKIKTYKTNQHYYIKKRLEP